MGDLENLCSLIRKRNAVADEITTMIGRPAQIGHIGEFIASRVFDIQLAHSAVHKGSDGAFRSGLLAGRSVNVKWYAKREGLLDIREDALPDYYLVLTGPSGRAMSSRGEARLWCIEFVFLFQATSLLPCLRTRGVKIGIATSVADAFWEAAQIHPKSNNRALVLSQEQHAGLRLFAANSVGV